MIPPVLVAARRILVVDDDDDIRTVLAAILSDEGFLVEEASNGRVALDRLESEREPLPDVVLLDLMMPVMDGWAVLHSLRGDARLAGLPVVLLSASPNIELADAGVRACLLKPVDLSALLRAVTAAA
jgi:CheY-like chemotaxis protein